MRQRDLTPRKWVCGADRNNLFLYHIAICSDECRKSTQYLEPFFKAPVCIFSTYSQNCRNLWNDMIQVIYENRKCTDLQHSTVAHLKEKKKKSPSLLLTGGLCLFTIGSMQSNFHFKVALAPCVASMSSLNTLNVVKRKLSTLQRHGIVTVWCNRMRKHPKFQRLQCRYANLATWEVCIQNHESVP